MKQPLTPDEYQRLLVASPRRWRDTWRVLRGTGLRVGELVHLRECDVDAARSAVTVTAWGDWTPKSRTSARTVPVPAPVLALLRARMAATLDTYRARLYAVTVRAIQQALARCVELAGLRPDITPHVFRHTYAAEYLAAGGSLRGLMALLGHSSLAATSAYLKPDEAEQRRVLEAQAV